MWYIQWTDELSGIVQGLQKILRSVNLWASPPYFLLLIVQFGVHVFTFQGFNNYGGCLNPRIFLWYMLFCLQMIYSDLILTIIIKIAFAKNIYIFLSFSLCAHHSLLSCCSSGVYGFRRYHAGFKLRHILHLIIHSQFDGVISGSPWEDSPAGEGCEAAAGVQDRRWKLVKAAVRFL